MTDFKDGEIKHILPHWLSERNDVQAISYAIKQQIAALIAYSAYIYGYAFVDGAPEYIVDLMALELRVKYYFEGIDLETKRELVKNAMGITLKDGTKWAVERLLAIIYGGGEETEWYDYNGIPNHFRLDIEAIRTWDFEIILNILDTVKRKTARLDGINLHIRSENHVNFGGITADYKQIRMRSQAVEINDHDTEHEWYAGHFVREDQEIYIGRYMGRTVYIFDGNGGEQYAILIDSNGRILSEHT